MPKVTAPQSPESPKSPGAGGNKHHDSGEGTFQKPMGEHTLGTPVSGPAETQMTGHALRPESAFSSLLPAKIEHSGGE